ncbi:MAG: Sulfate/thiosulfate import ATP-binding protein CysA [Planctomycetota bacterium]|jgi:ABC-type sugar transport system ATPase subunit
MIELQNVTLRIGSWQIRDLSFQVKGGEYAVLMGRTGIGKTSILESICGLRRVAAGRILIQSVDVTSWSPADRKVGYMPQDLALFPTMTVRQHLEFAPRIRGLAGKTIRERIAQLAERLEISPLLDRGIRGLSGGESQRVALGRALAAEPLVLLLDEPLSALDESTRIAAQKLLKRLNQEMGITVLHITHSREEAAALADTCLELDVVPESRRAVIQTVSLR